MVIICFQVRSGQVTPIGLLLRSFLQIFAKAFYSPIVMWLRLMGIVAFRGINNVQITNINPKVIFKLLRKLQCFYVEEENTILAFFVTMVTKTFLDLAALFTQGVRANSNKMFVHKCDKLMGPSNTVLYVTMPSFQAAGTS